MIGRYSSSKTVCTIPSFGSCNSTSISKLSKNGKKSVQVSLAKAKNFQKELDFHYGIFGVSQVRVSSLWLLGAPKNINHKILGGRRNFCWGGIFVVKARIRFYFSPFKDHKVFLKSLQTRQVL